MFSLPKPLVYVTIFGFFFFLCTSVTILLWAQGSYEQIIVQQEQNHALGNRLTEQDLLLESQVHETHVLREEKQRILDELRQIQTTTDLLLKSQVHETHKLREEKQRILDALRQIQTTENKIRRFLGLNERPDDRERSNQGGMGLSEELPHLEQDVSSTGSLLIGEEGKFSEFSQSLQSGLQEMLAHLEEKRLESRRLPTLLPVASNKVWLAGTFGWRKDPISGTLREFHNGIDIAGPWKSPIIAPADGTVLKVGKDRRLGVYIKLMHSNKIKTLYGHLASAAVKKRQKVKRGDVIGYMGNTGRSTGTHLHYSVAVNGKYVHPLDFVWDRPFRTLKL
jgi:murein DD-endopeptidase MepM/ murein hydrolase activator NlpD